MEKKLTYSQRLFEQMQEAYIEARQAYHEPIYDDVLTIRYLKEVLRIYEEFSAVRKHPLAKITYKNALNNLGNIYMDHHDMEGAKECMNKFYEGKMDLSFMVDGDEEI